MNPLEKALHQRALEIAGHYRKAESDLLEILQKIDQKKVFRSLRYTSLFQYAVSELRLSEGAAYNFISVARKAREIPEIKEEIKSGNLSVSTVRKIVSVIEPANAVEWLEKAKTLPRPQLEKEVAKTNPQILTPERSKIVAQDRLALQLGVSEKLHEKLLRVKDLLSQKLKRSVSLEEALDAMTDLYLEKQDPVAKAERAVQRAAKREVTPVPNCSSGTVPALARHQVTLRDRGQCRGVTPQGERCSQRRFLDLHHVQFRSQGGTHGVENLQLLYFHHHRAVHESASG